MCVTCNAGFSVNNGTCQSLALSCNQADSFECSASVCATYSWVNNSCVIDNASNCTNGQ